MIIKNIKLTCNYAINNQGIALFLTMFIVALASMLLLSISTVSIRQLNLTKLANERQTNNSMPSACLERVKYLFKLDRGMFNGCSIGDCVDLKDNYCIPCDPISANNSIDLPNDLACYAKIETKKGTCSGLLRCTVILGSPVFKKNEVSTFLNYNKVKFDLP